MKMKIFRHPRTGTVHATADGFTWSFCGLANSRAGWTADLTPEDVDCKPCRRRVEERRLRQR